MRELPMVPVTDPKFAPLFGHPPVIWELVHDPTPTGRMVGMVVFLPVPL